MAAIRASGSHSQEFWRDRIARYLSGEHNPQQALPERTVFVAVVDDSVVGFVAGHRTRRFGCDGELQWIDVAEDHRQQGIAGQLMMRIGAWFVGQDLHRVCVNVSAENTSARNLYRRFGAVALSEQWMVWEDAAAMAAKQIT